MNASAGKRTHNSKVKASVVALVLLALTLQIVSVGASTAESGSGSSASQTTSVPVASLQAASGATIRFKTQNGALTDPDERTLIVELIGIQVPPMGVTVTLDVVTQHADPDAGGDPNEGIPVWHASRWITNTQAGTTAVFTQTGVTLVFTHTFTERVVSGGETVATPTDYFQVEIAVFDAHHAATNPRHRLGSEYTFLMESQSIARLPEVREESPGAAPDELIVYYCDMIPFQSDDDSSTRLLRADIPDYVHTELLPAMVEAFRVQSDVWGFPWLQAWTSYRTEEEPGRLSVALTDGGTWFHGRALASGHSGISINVSNRHNAPDYGTLTDAIVSTFYHELFHNHQRGISQDGGGDGQVGGEKAAWQFFSEGTAELASWVGQPTVQFTQTIGARCNVSNANCFSAVNSNSSYETMFSSRLCPFENL